MILVRKPVHAQEAQNELRSPENIRAGHWAAVGGWDATRGSPRRSLSKGARVAPVNPPAGFVGEWPPPFWPLWMLEWWNSSYGGGNDENRGSCKSGPKADTELHAARGSPRY